MRKPNEEVVGASLIPGPMPSKRSILLALGLGLILASEISWAQQSSQDASNQGTTVTAISAGSGSVSSNQDSSSGDQINCQSLPGFEELTRAVKKVVVPGDKKANGGLGNPMWATVVDRSGTICLVTRSGEKPGDQWPGSRGVSAAKAYTANAFSLPGFALSTANLYWPSQPDNSLYGLESSNALNGEALHEGPPSSWGTQDDPLRGQRIGGATVFAGGLALYNSDGKIVGALGLSGDQSCTDHVIAWKIRHQLNLDNVAAGVTDAKNDNIIFDITEDPASGRLKSASGFGHPECSPRAKTLAQDFPNTHPTGPEK